MDKRTRNLDESILGKSRLLISLALAFPAGAAAADTVLEEVLVTGTRIARASADASSPIVVIEARAFEESPAVSVEATLNEFPQFAPSAGAASVDPASDGLATVSLRGLGPNRTLVLLDGRRLVPADGLGQVDLNVLPPELIESVDVVTGGASAVYGSDAVAGVVNFRLRRDFTGLKLTGQWSQAGEGDGEEYSAALVAGTPFADGRGSIMAHVGYSEREEIRQTARGFSRVPLTYYPDETHGVGPGGQFLAEGNFIVEDGIGVIFPSPVAFENLFASYGYPAGSVPYQPLLSVNADGTVFTNGLVPMGNPQPGGITNYRGEPDPNLSLERVYTSNYAPDTALQLPLERVTGSLFGRYQLSDSAEAYAQVLYADYSTRRRLSPVPANPALIPPTNPFLSSDLKLLLDSRQVPNAPFRFLRLLTELGPRISDNDRQLLQGTVGVNGRLHDWNYDVYVQAGRNDRSEYQTGNARLSRIQDLTFAADGGVAICGGFVPFAGTPMSPACASYVATDASNDITVKQLIGEASLSGELFRLPAGPVHVAAGLFHKRDEFDYRADPVLTEMVPGVPGIVGARPDVVGFAAGANRAGSESNTDVYVEAVLPLLGERPGVEALTLGLGYRRAEYEQAGGTDAYKAELIYRPVRSLRFRGSYQHAVRAPSIEELYFPEIANQFYLSPPDPCAVQSPERNGPNRDQVEALCLAQGISPELLENYGNPLARVAGVTGGNPELEPEKADSYTLGIVLSSPFSAPALETLEISLDGYWIELEDAIGRWEADPAVHRCFDPAFNPSFDPGNIYCSFFERLPETGEVFARLIDRNIGGLETAGVDLQLHWHLDAGPGRITTEAYATHVYEWRFAEPGGSTIDYHGRIGGVALGSAVPEWKGQVRLGYAWGDADLHATWRYIDSMRDVVYPAFKVPARDYLDVGIAYSFGAGALQGLVLRAGVENLLDEQPPIYPTYQQANTEPALYDVLGKRYYLSAGWKF